MDPDQELCPTLDVQCLNVLDPLDPPLFNHLGEVKMSGENMRISPTCMHTTTFSGIQNSLFLIC